MMRTNPAVGNADGGALDPNTIDLEEMIAAQTAPAYIATYGVELIDRGFDVVPIQPGLKHPGLTGWESQDFAPSIRAGNYGGCGVGVRTTGTPAIDVDATDGELAEAMRELLIKRLTGTVAFRVGLAPKFAIVCRTLRPFKKQTSHCWRRPDAPAEKSSVSRVEILGAGQQIVVYHTHPVTGLPYVWERADLFELNVADLPEIDIVAAQAIATEFDRVSESMGFVVCNSDGSLPDTNKRIARSGRTKGTAIARKAPTRHVIMNIAEIYSALYSIPPDISHDEWVTRVGMPLHAANPAVNGDTFALWDAWSSTGRNYPGVDQLSYKWSTFDASGGITLKSLFAFARECGWTGDYLLDETGREMVKQQNRDRLDDFDRRHGVICFEGATKFARRVFKEDVAGTVAGRWETNFSSVSDMLVFYENVRIYDVIFDKEAGQWVAVSVCSVFSRWRTHANRRTYPAGVEFRPIRGLVLDDDSLPNGEALNLYTGLSVTPVAGDCTLLLEHIRTVWCRGDAVLNAYVLNWLARMFQRPAELGATVIVLLSAEEGTGKGIVLDALMDIMGKHAFMATKREQVTGNFNGHIADAVLLVMNESTWGGNKDAAGALKSLITDPNIPVDRKFIPATMQRNCCHLMVCSNEEWAVPVGLTDRRFLVLDVSDARRKDFPYFKAIASELGNGGREAFCHYLLTRDIQGFDPRALPDAGTRKTELKLRSTDSFMRWLLMCLSEKVIAIHDKDGTSVLVSESAWESGDVFVETGALYLAYSSYVDVFEKSAKEHHATFGKRLVRAPIGAVQRRPSSGSRKPGYLLPNLVKARQNWESVIGSMGEWDE